MDGRFVWNNDAAARKWRDHGIAFDQAVKAIVGPFAIEWIDDREAYDEERVDLLGMSSARYIHGTR